ncbi:MAG: 2-oxoglutarate dehydrogenase E1 component, partial [Desulfobacterales bacterium]
MVQTFHAPAFIHEQGALALGEILKALKETYCRKIGVEYMHLQDPGERAWLQERMEPIRNRPQLSAEARTRIMADLTRATLFEQVLNSKYLAQTRFSLEGAEGLIPLMTALADHLAELGGKEIILGMAHRGRLNVLANVLQRPLEDIFSEFEHCYDPEALLGDGDVKYHSGYLGDITTAGGHPLQVLLMNNPSHLESVNPVVAGFARGRQELAAAEAGDAGVVPILIHGDAAFAGQGLVAETLNMSQLAGYRNGGTLHLIINNQIGYTTLPEDARSTRYATDVAKMLMVPVFHVHGEDPEALVHVARLAADYRAAFAKDVVIDMVCYRRYGHNEGDEPYFTQPRMYERIRARPTLHTLYRDQLQEAGLLAPEAQKNQEQTIRDDLEAAYQAVHQEVCAFPQDRFYDNWERYSGRFSHDPIETAVARSRLDQLSQALNSVPENFNLNKKLNILLKRRREALAGGTGIDWANAEALAWGSLLLEGVPVRLSGQDVQRGTFSQRHSVWSDTETGETYTPLNHLAPDQAPYQAYNSLLAEAGVVGFEYGYALAQPGTLTLWEAQFGDFVNNAQAVIDLYIASGEAKWQRLNGLVMLLPHGLEGLGPEHSSARPERFLQLCAEENLQVVNPSTPAQYFHLLRRQVLAPFRKPLIVLTPKSLLRHPLAVSTIDEFTSGTFSPLLADPEENLQAGRVLLCSGKVYYDLLQRRREVKRTDTALIRVEQLYPLAESALADLVGQYPQAKKWYWVQEEPANMGAWNHLRPDLNRLLPAAPEYIGRPAAATPATGFPAIYSRQRETILTAAIGALPEKSHVQAG